MRMADGVNRRLDHRIWLGAGVMAAGLGMAVATGHGMAVAEADEGGPAGGTTSESSSATDTSAAPSAGEQAASAGSTAREPKTLRAARTGTLRVRTAAAPVVRVSATTQRDTAPAVPEPEAPELEAPRTVTVGEVEAEAESGGQTTESAVAADGVVGVAQPDTPYDRRRPESDTRPARSERDTGRADGDELTQQPVDESKSVGVANPVVGQPFSTAAGTAAKPVTIGSLIGDFMARLGIKPVKFNLDFLRVPFPKMIQNWWADVRTRFFGLPRTPTVVPPVVPGPVDPAPGAAEPVLLWETNFTSIDEAVQAWSLQSGRWGQSAGENQYYTADFSNVTVDANGHLVITVRRGPTPDGAAAPHDYTSARVVTYGKQSVLPNSRIVARIQMPYAKGLLPAFWMVGLEPGHEFDWPRQGEVDIAEYPGFGTEEGRTHWTGNIHGPAAGNNTLDVKLDTVGAEIGVDLSQGFHEYGIDWYPDRIVWHVDGVQTGQVTKAQYEALGGDWTPFSGAWPHYLILNTAVGNPWTGDPDASAEFGPQQMKVDWVKVYSLGAVAG